MIAASFCDPREIVGPAPEFMTADANDSDFISKARFSAVGLGPGLGASDSTSELISQLYQSGLDSVVLDADALTNLANKRQPLRPSWILTPHAGELSRLIGREAKAIESDRFQACQAAAKEWGTIVLLKGFRTVISDGEKTAVVMAGNSSLAKAGSGDVLTGLITGLMAQGVRPFAAACLGSYLHGRLADEWVKSGRDRISLEAGDIAEALPLIIRRVRDGALS